MHGPDDLKEQVDEGHVVTLREATILMLALAHRHQLEALCYLEGPEVERTSTLLQQWRSASYFPTPLGSDAGLGSPVPEFRMTA